ncbi:Glucan 1,3-beta-glucosidase 3 [Coniothyrium glycines]
MKGFFQKAKADLKVFAQRDNAGHPGAGLGHKYGLQAQHPGPEYPGGDAQHTSSQGIAGPTPLDVIRYRYHHATNLGSIFVVERWLQPSRFPDGSEGSSELASVKAWVDRIGLEATKQKFEGKWRDAVSEEDIRWLINVAKATTIRLPIGYYNLPLPDFTRGTPFEPYAYVYSGAWQSIRNLVSRLQAHSIGVLVDLHALPGGANSQEHSGTNSGRTELWTNSTNRALGVKCCQFLAQETRNGFDVAGIQLVNEAEWDAPGMYEWYDECVGVISSIDPGIPIIISDGWNLDKAIDWTLQKNLVGSSHNPIIIDTHYYWAFSDEDKQKSPQQIIGEVWTKLDKLNGKEGSVIDRGAVQVIVGEYSCVLTEDSWAKSDGVPKEELVRQFGQTQSQRWQQRAGGSFFWTWKMDWMPGGEWGFKAQVEANNIIPPCFAHSSREEKASLVEKGRSERESRMHDSVQQHIDYWNRTDPNGHYEHEKFIEGWGVGYSDALAFFDGRGQQSDKIGMLEVWILKRIRESGFRGGFTWLFEQGLRKGIQDFYAVVGV